MSHFESRMAADGQLPVPPEVREAFRLKDGDIVDFYLDTNHRSIRLIVRNGSVLDLVGLLAPFWPPEDRPLSQEKMDDSIGDYLAEKHMRIAREWNERQEFEAWKKSGKPRAAE